MSGAAALRQYGEALAGACVLAFLLRTFVVQAFSIPSASMSPTLLPGDHVLISKLHYGLRRPWGTGWLLTCARPSKGDVIVFVPPNARAESTSPRHDFVKRVVAVEGDALDIAVEATHVHDISEDFPGRAGGDVGGRRLGPDQFFVLGDNHRSSRDSREWGPINMADIEGRALLIYWSRDPGTQRVRWERIGRLIR